MAEEKTSPELNYDEQKDDLGDKSDNDSHSNGSNSQISVLGLHQIRNHCWMIVSFVILACLVIFALGMSVGFIVQQNEISNLEQQLTAHINALSERIDDLESQHLHCKHCNLTIHSDSSSYDDQELRMKLNNVCATQNEMQSRLNTIQFALFDQRQEIVVLQQQMRENFTQTEAKVNELGDHIANISEQVDHLNMMQGDHSDQLSQINSHLTNISTQLTHFNGSLNNISSGLAIQKTEIESLTSSVSTLNFHVNEIDRRDTMKDSELQQSISLLDQRVGSIQLGNTRMSTQLNTFDRRLDHLEERSGAAAFYPICTAITIAVILVTIFAL